MRLGERIRQARRAKDLSQGELAWAVGVSTNAIHRIEVSATPDPCFSHVRRIAEVLDVSLDALVAEVEYPAPRANGRRVVLS